MNIQTELYDAACSARSWLLEDAAPLWAQRGRTSQGLVAERISLTGQADGSYFRTFVQARHIFSFVTIGSLGWMGPWEDLVTGVLNSLLDGARRGDGLFVHRLDQGSRPIDRRADLYDQAFVLLALGVAGRALARSSLFDEAERLLDCIERFWTHPHLGFQEGEVINASHRRQNPHMHLLEAFIVLHEASGRERFGYCAMKIADLASSRFIDSSTGALREYFADDLSPLAGAEGNIVEPGHCFEWAWLFERLGCGGMISALTWSDRLTEFARIHGLDWNRGVAVNEVLTDGTVRDFGARLWPQTERLKAAIARYARLASEEEAIEALAAAKGLQQYFRVPIAGLWRDKLQPNGDWVDEHAPGSSLYHISCAIAELARVQAFPISTR